jgi:hypothetical protein
MRTTLRAEVEISTITVVAELAVLERRPELALVCRAAQKQGALEPRVLSGVLPGLSEAACANLRRHYEYLGLCDEAGRLTEAGRLCAERSEAPIPEQGVYTFWIARHPLCGVLLLHFRREQLDPRDSDFDSLQPVPEWFRADRHHPWESVVDRGMRFCLRALLGPSPRPVRCRLAPAPACQLSWEVDLLTWENQWLLAGKLEWREGEQQRREPFTTPHQSVAELDGGALFASWEPRWRPEQGFAAMDFDGKVGGHDFRRTLRYPSVSVPGKGTYTNVEVLDVPVGPSNRVQAQRWADALLRSALKKETGYVTDSRLRTLFDTVVRDTPLSGFSVALAGVEEHLKALEADARLYWMLAAPFDLQPEAAAGVAAVKGAV